MGFPIHIIDLIKSLYQEQEATVRTNAWNTDWFQIGKGVKQGCTLWPHLFSVCAEVVMCEAQEELNTGIKIDGRKINDLCYADCTTLISCPTEEMEEMLKRICVKQVKRKDFLNVIETKIMSIGGNVSHGKIRINGEEIEVEELDYLGSRISKNVSSTDIKRRQATAKSLVAGLSKLWKSRDLPIATTL